ncbi:MAG: glycosyltransferase 87 family protein [Gemmataceae bacterium]
MPADRLRSKLVVRTAVGLWVVLLGVTCVRTVLKPLSANIYPTYAWAGERFAAGEPLYGVFAPYIDNYRYSPVVAAGFVPFGMMPWGPGGAIFRLLGAALFLGGCAAWFRRSWPDAPVAAALGVTLPLAIGSVSNGQANPHMVGLMVAAGALALGNRWAVAGACVAAAALFKGYPLALGMLLMLAAPARFGVGLVAALAAGLALPYLLQSPEYVTGLYHEWRTNLAGDDRTGWESWRGYQDFHLLLKTLGWTAPRSQYLLVQAGTGALCAAVLGWQRWRGVDRPALTTNAVTLGLCWMTVFGPAVESSTLILIAPVLSRELLDRAGQPRWASAATWAGAVLFLGAVVIFAFPHAVHRPVIGLGIQPLAAALVAAAGVARVVRTRPPETTPSLEVLTRRAA